MSGLLATVGHFLVRVAGPPANVAASMAGQAKEGVAHPPAPSVPDRRPAGDPPSTLALDEQRARFAALLSRLEADARRDGLHDDGPMTPVLKMLTLCMDILREVTSQNIRVTERHAAQVVGAIESAKDGAKYAVEWTHAELVRKMASEHDHLAHRFAGSVVSRMERDIERRVRQFSFKTGCWLCAVLIGSVAAMSLVVHSQTASVIRTAEASAHAAALTAVLAVVRDTKDGFARAFAAEGMVGATRWKELMEWNSSISAALAQCSTNKDLIIDQPDGRRACTVPLYI